MTAMIIQFPLPAVTRPPVAATPPSLQSGQRPALLSEAASRRGGGLPDAVPFGPAAGGVGATPPRLPDTGPGGSATLPPYPGLNRRTGGGRPSGPPGSGASARARSDRPGEPIAPGQADRLARALESLRTALAEQRGAVAAWRASLAELHGAVASLDAGLTSHAASLQGLGVRVGQLHGASNTLARSIGS